MNKLSFPIKSKMCSDQEKKQVKALINNFIQVIKVVNFNYNSYILDSKNPHLKLDNQKIKTLATKYQTSPQAIDQLIRMRYIMLV